ncbi:flagellar protein FliT [Paraburkholderia solisilvae]|nr:flagellar protein FliT [Paraburkholderia solisilvae]
MIEEAAAIADWPRVARLMERRSPLLESLTLPTSPAALQALRQVRASIDTLRARAQTARTELEVEFGASFKNVQAANAYVNVGML